MSGKEIITEVIVSSEDPDANCPILIRSLGDFGYEVGWKTMMGHELKKNKEDAIEVFREHFRAMIEHHEGEDAPYANHTIAKDEWGLVEHRTQFEVSVQLSETPNCVP